MFLLIVADHSCCSMVLLLLLTHLPVQTVAECHDSRSSLDVTVAAVNEQ